MEPHMRPIPATVLLVSVALTVFPACAKGPPKLATDQDKTLYALGQAISKSLDAFQLTPQELAIVESGIEDGVSGKPAAVEMTKYADKLQELHRTRSEALTQKEKTNGAAYVAKAAAEKGATKTASGIVITTLTPGTGA